MSISIGSKLVTDISFYNHPLAQVSVGPVVVWEAGGGALVAQVRLRAGEANALRVALMVENYQAEGFEVRWGDGAKSTEADYKRLTDLSSYDAYGVEHVYEAAGDYSIQLRGGAKVAGTYKYPLVYLSGASQLLGLEVRGVCPIRQWREEALRYTLYSSWEEVQLAIPAGLFSGIGKLETSLEAERLFNCGLWGGEVPENFFAGLPSNVTQVHCRDVFQYCKLSGSIPQNIFAPLSRVTAADFSGMFSYLSSSVSVPESLFAPMTLLLSLNCAHMFDFDGLKGSVPTGLWSKQAYLTSLECGYMLAGTGLSGSVPTNFFSGLKGLKKLDCSALFSGCNGLSGSVPTGMFKGVLASSGVELDCGMMFEKCDWVKAAPSSAFLEGLNQAGGCTALDVHGLFHQCKNLTGTAPGGWFSAGKGYSFRRQLSNIYQETGVTGIASNLLDGVPDDGSGQDASGYYPTDIKMMFYNCKGLKGTLPSFWSSFTKLQWPAYQGFYMGCTGASNYGNVPSQWKSMYTI